MKHFEFKIAYLALFVAFLYVSFSLLPYSWYVKDEVTSIDDVCVGEDTLIFHATRIPKWGMTGSAFNEVVEFTDDYKLETTITRQADFIYEPNSTEAVFQVTFNKPLNKTGSFGINAWNTIYPLPFIEVHEYIPPEERLFNVIDCNI